MFLDSDMPRNIHVCQLNIRRDRVLNRVHPNAWFWQRACRYLRTLIALDPSNSQCRAVFRSASSIYAEQRRHATSRYFYVIHPFSKLSSALRIVFLFVWLHAMLVEPVYRNLVLDSRPYVFNQKYIIPTVRVLLLSFFFKGYVVRRTGEIVTDHKRIALRYLRTYFVVDFIGADVFYDAVVYWFRVHQDSALVKAIDCLHTPCQYVRLFTMLDYFESVLHNFRMEMRPRKCMVLFLQTAMVLHFFACMVYVVPYVMFRERYPADSWVALAGIRLGEDASVLKRYGESWMMSTCHFLGACEGLHPVTVPAEQMVFVAVVVIGRLYTLFLLGNVLSLFSVSCNSESNYERKFNQLNQYIAANNLSDHLRGQITRYFEYKYQKNFFNEQIIHDELSPGLHHDMLMVYAGPLFQKNHVLKLLNSQAVADLVAHMTLETFAPGDVIVREEEPVTRIYFVSTGTLAMNRGDLELCHLEDGDSFGMIYLSVRRNDYTLVALEASNVFSVELEEMAAAMEPFPEARQFAGELVKRKLRQYQECETTARLQGVGCLVDLRKGKMLEKRRARKTLDY